MFGTVVMADDPNEAAVTFILLGARPLILATPLSSTPPGDLVTAQSAIVLGPQRLPAGQWRQTYKGLHASAFVRIPADEAR